MAKAKVNPRAPEPAGLWHQPLLLNLLADVLIVTGIAGIAWAGLAAMQRLPLFPLQEVVLVTPPQRVSVEQLTHAARTALVGNFFTIDLEMARATFEKLPWVRKAAVQRQWPGKLILSLEEHEVAAHWRHLNGDAALVNRQGEVFAVDVAEALPRLPRLSGPEGSAAELLARHGEFNALLAPLGRSVEAMALSSRRAWQLRLDDNVTIELGREQERLPIKERVVRFAAHYEFIKSRVGSPHVVDMRYPNGFALAGVERGGRHGKADSAGQKS